MVVKLEWARQFGSFGSGNVFDGNVRNPYPAKVCLRYSSLWLAGLEMGEFRRKVIEPEGL